MDEVASQLSPWSVLLKDDLILPVNPFAGLIAEFPPVIAVPRPAALGGFIEDSAWEADVALAISIPLSLDAATWFPLSDSGVGCCRGTSPHHSTFKVIQIGRSAQFLAPSPGRHGMENLNTIACLLPGTMARREALIGRVPVNVFGQLQGLSFQWGFLF
jgi:hypothetical protein